MRREDLVGKLNVQGVHRLAMKTWSKVKRVYRAVSSVMLYQVLGMIHLALVTNAGLLILFFAPSVFGAQFIPKSLSLFLVSFVAYVVCDLIRFRFLRGATISLGFSLILFTLLVDSPFVALLVAALGSLVSEVIRSRFFSKQRLFWFGALRRALFYAGHHAVASLGALIVYQLLRGHFESWLLLDIIHIQATLAYILTYSLVSMLLIWPHDLRIHLFLTPDEEPLVRIDFTTLLLLPLPASIFYLYSLNLGQAQKVLIVVGVLPPLFLLLFLLARNFARAEEERVGLALREEVSQHLGSPANMAEMVERMLMIIGQLVDYRWGALYGQADGELKLSGVKPDKGRAIVMDQGRALETELTGRSAGTDRDQVRWSPQIKPDEGILAKLVRESPPSQFFYDGYVPATPSDPYLPQKTALIVFPITGESQGEGEIETTRLISLIALARPKRRFTTWDWEKGQALSSRSVNMLLSVQRLERVIRELYQKVEDYAEDPERVRQAVQQLVLHQVDVSKILAVVSERSFRGNVRAVLRGVVEGRRGHEVSFEPDMLIEIYNQVRDETPGMPPVSSNILELLQTVTSSLSLAFSFRYQFPDVERGPAFTGCPGRQYRLAHRGAGRADCVCNRVSPAAWRHGSWTFDPSFRSDRGGR
jgi:hypothetical protein